MRHGLRASTLSQPLKETPLEHNDPAPQVQAHASQKFRTQRPLHCLQCMLPVVIMGRCRPGFSATAKSSSLYYCIGQRVMMTSMQKVGREFKPF